MIKTGIIEIEKSDDKLSIAFITTDRKQKIDIPNKIYKKISKTISKFIDFEENDIELVDNSISVSLFHHGEEKVKVFIRDKLKPKQEIVMKLYREDLKKLL